MATVQTDQVTLTIDGQSITVPKGTLILAARAKYLAYSSNSFHRTRPSPRKRSPVCSIACMRLTCSRQR